MRQPAVYVTLVEDMSVVSLANGGTRTYYLTPKKFFGLGMNLENLVACLRTQNATANVGVTTKLQWSFDGQTWTNDVGSVVAQQTADGDAKGAVDAATFPPFVRLYVEVVATSGTDQVGADITMWGYYKFRV